MIFNKALSKVYIILLNITRFPFLSHNAFSLPWFLKGVIYFLCMYKYEVNVGDKSPTYVLNLSFTNWGNK